MTPLSFAWFSLIAVADTIVLVIAVALVVGVIQGYTRTAIQIYFQEYEQFMRRMAESGIPAMPTELMH